MMDTDLEEKLLGGDRVRDTRNGDGSSSLNLGEGLYNRTKSLSQRPTSQLVVEHNNNNLLNCTNGLYECGNASCSSITCESFQYSTPNRSTKPLREQDFLDIIGSQSFDRLCGEQSILYNIGLSFKSLSRWCRKVCVYMYCVCLCVHARGHRASIYI